MRPTARYASLNRYIELGQNLGIDPGRLIRKVGLDPAGLALQDTRVPAASIARLLEDSATESGREDFGVMLAELRQFSNLGPLSLVLREEPEVRSALELLIRYEHTYNEALRLRMWERDALATISVKFDWGDDDAPDRQSSELAIGVLNGILREFLGQEWTAVAVCFSHSAPPDLTVHERLFGITPQFDQPFTGVVIYGRDLDATNRMADPNLGGYAHEFLRFLPTPKDQGTLDRVRDLIRVFLPAGRCSLSQISRELHLDRRTVHRHLAAHGQSFSSLLDEVRSELAEQYLGNNRYSLTEVSLLLGFSAPSGFSRWFRAQYGCSPSDWRQDRLVTG